MSFRLPLNAPSSSGVKYVDERKITETLQKGLRRVEVASWRTREIKEEEEE